MDNVFGNSIAEQGATQASIYSDLNSLDSIRRLSKTDQKGAIQAAAKEFESFFLNMMLKSMRKASEVIGADSPLSSNTEKMYMSMLDEQLSVDLSRKGQLGIANLLAQEINRNNGLPNQVEVSSVPLRNSNSIPVELHTKPTAVSTAPTNEITIDVQGKKTTRTAGTLANLENEKKSRAVNLGQQNMNELTKVTKAPIFESMQGFIEKVLPIAKSIASKLGVDPKLMVAQSALETGWGQYVAHHANGVPGYNMFGIKANDGWQGSSLNMETIEVEDGVMKKTTGRFRSYDDIESSFKDFVQFLKQGQRYSKALEVVEKPQAYLQALQESGYATDPNYAKKIWSIYQRLSSE